MTKTITSTSAVSAARWSLIQGVLGILLQFATLALLARLLEPAIFGAMAILLVVQGIATLFAQMGLSSALIQRSELTESAFNSLYWLNVTLGITVTLILFLVGPIVSAVFGIPELRTTTSAIGVTFFISCWSIQFQALAQKQLRFRRIALINLAALLATAIVSVLLAWRGFGLWSLVCGVIAASIVRSLGFLVSGIRDNGVPALHFNWSEARELVIFGAHRFGAMLVNAVNSHIDQLLVGGMLGAQALGFYSMATRIVLQPTDLMNPIVTRVAFPWLSRLQDDNEKLKNKYLEIVGLVIAANAPILAAAAALADWYVPLLLGEGWDSVTTLIQILAGYALLRSVINAGGSLILAKGRADWTFYWNIFLLFLYPAAIYLAARSGDLSKLALTLTCLQVIVLFLYHRALIQPLTGIRVGRFLSAISKPMSSALVAGLVAYTSVRLIDQTNNWLNVMIGVTVGAIVYAAWRTCLMPQQVATLRKIAFSKQQQDENI